jgi:hypothetical protein
MCCNVVVEPKIGADDRTSHVHNSIRDHHEPRYFIRSVPGRFRSHRLRFIFEDIEELFMVIRYIILENTNLELDGDETIRLQLLL